jgi:myosin heavy subunit
MSQPITSYFNPNLPEDFIAQWSLFLGIPANDGLTRASAQIISTTHNLNTDIKSSINTLTQVGDQWQGMNNNMIDSLTTAVQTIGTISIRHEEMSRDLNKLTAHCEKLENSNQQLLEMFDQSQKLYQDSLTRNQELENSYKSTEQLNQKLFGSLEKLTAGFAMNEQLRQSQTQEFQTSIEQLKNVLRKPFSDLAENHKTMGENLAGQATQILSFEQSAIKSALNLSQNQLTTNREVATLSRSIERITNKIEGSLANYQLATWAITGVCAMLLIFLIWTSASHAATISTGNAYINAFGGREYYQASLEIMDDRNRDFNLKRLEECRKSKPVKNSKEAYMECELRAKKSS